MHWVDRGIEPARLGRIRDSFTQRWIDYFEGRNPTKPRDAHWQKFLEDLRQAFSGLCAFCERSCRGEVDHFRPTRKFPELVYVWTNWLFACHACNLKKWQKWPPRGYIDPCTRVRQARPEHYFTFDLVSGYIVPRESLSDNQYDKAARMIEDIGLNEDHHLKRRLIWIDIINEAADTLPDMPEERAQVWRNRLLNLCAREAPLSSLARTVVQERLPDLDLP